MPFLPQLGSQGERRDLIHDFSGVVRDGEMLFVLGRPGSGCSTFLKAISNKREGFAGVTGWVILELFPPSFKIETRFLDLILPLHKPPLSLFPQKILAITKQTLRLSAAMFPMAEFLPKSNSKIIGEKWCIMRKTTFTFLLSQ